MRRLSSQNRAQRSGATTVEMTFIGIPIIFILISIFEMARGMWMYHTGAYAVKEGVRFAIVHGVNCVNAPPSVNNSCAKTVNDIATVILNAGIGLDAASTTMTLTTPWPGGTVTTCTLAGSPGGCGAAVGATVWPGSPGNTPGTVIRIDLIYPFNSALAMFWPGQRPVAFGVVNLGASSIDTIQF